MHRHREQLMRALTLLLSLWCGSAFAACGPDAAPAIASAYGLTCEVFNDPMTSAATFDVNNTLAPGFNWYLRQDWPNARDNASSGIPPTTGVDYTIDGSGTTMHPVAGFHEKSIFSTCAASSATAAGYVGTVFQGSFYADITYNYTIGDNTYHLLWMIPTEYLTGGQATPGTIDELDILESTPFNSRWIHEWSYTAGVATGTGSYEAGLGGSTNGTLVIAPALNDGTYGLLKRATNDVVYSTLQFGPTVVPIDNGSSTALPVGMFKYLNTNHFCLMLASAIGAPFTVSSVKIWMAPPGNGGGGGRRGPR
jgi:hypothetical protein